MPPTDPETLSAVMLRRMSAEDWTRVIEGDRPTLVLHVRSAARHGFRAGQITWGQMLLDGRDVPRDRAAALHWFGRAAATGSPDGLNMVGRCHELGWGTPVDHGEALNWFRRAAERGSDWGRYNAGCMLLYGEGVAHDAPAALAFFEEAAGHGHAKAMGLLGRCREEGWGAPPDPAAALGWYRAGAEAGDCWSQGNLATIMGRQGERDAALAWFRRSLGSGTANYLDALAAELRALPDPELASVAREATARAAALRAAEGGEPEAPSGAARLLRRFGRG